MDLFSNPQSRAYARITGLFYLIIAAAGFFAILYVPGQLFTPSDAAASLAAITERRGLFNLGIAGDVTVMLAELAATAMLFFMFRHVSETLSLIAALARLMMVAVMAAMLFFYAAALKLAGPELAVLGEGRAALGGLMLHLHDTGVVIWQLFFWVHLMILGQLVAGSGQFPRLIGHAMSLGAFGYLLDSANKFLAPEGATLGNLTAALLVVVSLAEIGFALWLLVRGPRQPETGAAVAA